MPLSVDTSVLCNSEKLRDNSIEMLIAQKQHFRLSINALFSTTIDIAKNGIHNLHSFEAGKLCRKPAYFITLMIVFLMEHQIVMKYITILQFISMIFNTVI